MTECPRRGPCVWSIPENLNFDQGGSSHENSRIIRKGEDRLFLCGASIPRKLSRILARYGDHPEALREAGIAYAIDQISDLVAAGVDGIHLYTMNNPAVARQISDSVSAIRRV